MSRRIIDLSAPIVASPPDTPEPLRTEISFTAHAGGAQAIEAMFGVPPRLLRDGEGWAVEEFTRFGTHNSTHVDAPWHYNSTVAGERAQTIDELPLEWFFNPAVCLDFHTKPAGAEITEAEVQTALGRLAPELSPGEIVLMRTDRDEFLDAPDYMVRGPGVTAEATRWLYEQGVRVMGIDAWGWDAPLNMQAEAARESGETGVFWAAHQADIPYCQIERLANLAALPPTGFEVACFPRRLVGGRAARARVGAALP